MRTREFETAPLRVARPPRAMVWVLLVSSTAAVLLVGIFATLLVFGSLVALPVSVPPAFWLGVGWASALTIASLWVRSLRWVFLLRRAEARIPIRDAYIAYFAGFSLLFAPLLLGEIAIRAWVHRVRGRVPVATTIVVNLWERTLDLTAVAAIAAGTGLVMGSRAPWHVPVLVAVALTAIDPLRRALLALFVRVARIGSADRHPDLHRLADAGTWFTSLTASLFAWALPGIGFWTLARGWGGGFGVLEATSAYTASAGFGGVAFAPGGVLIAGREMLAALAARGFPGAEAVLTVAAVRLATAGVSTALGVVFLLIHLRSSRASAASHFDEIADAYDVQIPESRRRALLVRKTQLMREALQRVGRGVRGIDIGCGQGAYVAEMRRLGFDVVGIDQSEAQVRLAGRNTGGGPQVKVGSVLDIPEADETFDFAYVINVLHHLSSIAEQRRAFTEIFRVLKPGGTLFVHEINTRNMLFRFYMGYVFPSLNCIDEGIERWLLPNHMAEYTDATVIDVQYFTFLPEFVPTPVVRLLRPFERLLEASVLRVYSAHFMAVLRKP